MKLLLTSGGIRNNSIRTALENLLGKPTSEANALLVPTALIPTPNGPNALANVIKGIERAPLVSAGWKTLGVLDVPALSSFNQDYWETNLRNADVLLVAGGDALFLAHWMRQSGLDKLLPTLPNLVYVGLSAGSMVATPRIGQDFVTWNPDNRSDETLNWVPFSIFPHLEHPEFPENAMAGADQWAAELDAACYAIDDETAIQVVDGEITVISEGLWKRY